MGTVGDETLDAQYERIRKAYFEALETGRHMQTIPDFVTRDERDRAFAAMVDVSEWNRRHPERMIGPTCPE